MHTVNDYLALYQRLTPRGAAWPTDYPDSLLNLLLYALAYEPARADARVDSLIVESDPRLTYELLADWERVLGLPDGCAGLAETINGRRNAVVGKLNMIGGQSPQYFIDLAAAYGYEITITEFDPFTVNTPITEGIRDEDWQFYWQVNAVENQYVYFDTTSPVTDPLRSWGNEQLECLINRHKPAHTDVIFAYFPEPGSGLDFSNPDNSQYLPLV